EMTSLEIQADTHALALILRVLRIYPQVLSLYVGFDTGDFFMVTHLAGENSAALRAKLKAPIITADGSGERKTRWVFLGEDGAVVGRLDPATAEFDPRQRPWYDAAKRTADVEQSDMYIFATSGEPGFTLSRSFVGQAPGVIGADLTAADPARFLHDQR